MRNFVDELGKHWQAAVLDASFGNAMLVFSQIESGNTLKHELYAANLAEAEQRLAAMSEAELGAALSEAEPWEQAQS